MFSGKNISERKADMSVRDFIKHHYRHFNAAVIVDAYNAYIEHLARGGKMFLTMAGAMSKIFLICLRTTITSASRIIAICPMPRKWRCAIAA